MCRIFFLLAMIVSFMFSFDYKLDGWASSWNKQGFNIGNPAYVDPDKGIFPTESYSTLEFFLGANLELYKNESSSLDVGFSGIIAWLPYDSTKTDKKLDGSYYVPDGVSYNYVGFYNGYLGDKIQPGLPYLAGANYAHNSVLSGAYLHFNSEYFEFWGGRYAVPSESYADLFSSYTQGVDLVFKYNDFRAFFEASLGRANASMAGWVYDWYSPYTVKTKEGKTANYGMYFVGMDWQKNGFLVRPNFYFYPTLYYIPSLKLTYDTSPEFFSEKGWGSETKFLIFSTFAGPNAIGALRYGNYVDKFALSLDFVQNFKISLYNVGFGIHKNFGNANGYLGNRGNTVFLSFVDIWDNSVYDIGQSASNSINADAITPYLFGGGHYKDFHYSIMGRLTYAKRANEQAIRLSASYSFKKEALLVGAYVEFYRDETKPGYLVGSYRPPNENNPGNISDRSHLVVFMKYNFFK